MRLFKLFTIVSSITVILAIIQLSGYSVLESLIVMLIISFFTLAASVRLDTKSSPSSIDIEKDIMPRLQKIDNMEKMYIENSQNHVTKADLEQAFRKHNDDITYLLDRMAKKTLELEDKLTKFGNSLVDSLSSVRGQVKELENKKEGESFSLGELVYVEDEKEDS